MCAHILHRFRWSYAGVYDCAHVLGQYVVHGASALYHGRRKRRGHIREENGVVIAIPRYQRAVFVYIGDKRFKRLFVYIRLKGQKEVLHQRRKLRLYRVFNY